MSNAEILDRVAACGVAVVILYLTWITWLRPIVGAIIVVLAVTGVLPWH